MQDNLQEAVEVLSQALQSNPLSRLAWLQFIFEGDATKFHLTSRRRVTGT